MQGAGGAGGHADAGGASGMAGAGGLAGASGTGGAAGGAGAGTGGAAGAAACGDRGESCCAGAVCNARATCDGTACIAADVWASELDGTFDFNGATWPQPLLAGTTQPLPSVNAIWGTSPTFIVAAGNSGLVLQNMGSGWHKQTVGDGSDTFYGVAGAGASDVWAVGDTTFAHWTGTTWSTVSAPSGANGLPFYAVWLSGPGAGWAVGEEGCYAQLTSGTWTFVGHSSDGYSYLGVWGSAANDVYVVGNGHSIAGIGDPLLIRHYDGTGWTDVSANVDPNHASPPLNAIWGADATHVWAVGEGGNAIFWNGTLWTPLLTGAGSSESLKAVWGSGARDVWVVGSAGVRHFDGTSWSLIPGLNMPTTVWLSPN